MRSPLVWRLLALVLACAPTLLLALSPELDAVFIGIRKRESGGNPFAIFDNTTRKSYLFTNRGDAETKAQELVARGHNLDLGLYQLNWKWQGRRPGLTLQNVFDAALNEKMARTVLEEFYTAARALYPSRDEAVRMAVGAYNNGKVRVHNPTYVNGVYRLSGLAMPYGSEDLVAAAPRRAPAVAVNRGVERAESDLARAYRGDPRQATLSALSTPDGDEALPMAEEDFDDSGAEGMLALLSLVAVAMLVVLLLALLKLLPWVAGAAGAAAKRVALRAAMHAALAAQRRVASDTQRMARVRR
jgi:type IV secretion system protein VirB1